MLETCRKVQGFPPLWWAFTDFPPVAPFYWDVYSAEERIKVICDYLWKTINFSEDTAEQFQGVEDALSALQKEFEQFKESGFNDYYQEQVSQWIAENLDYVFTKTAKQVFFGLTQEGYFVAYVPESWDDIIFDTGVNYADDTYGRLILRWETDSASTVNQTPEPSRYGVIY